MIQKKTRDSETKPPALMATIKDMKGKDVDFIFNKTENHFRYDVVTIRYEGIEIDIVRDELGKILLNSEKITDKELS